VWESVEKSIQSKRQLEFPVRKCFESVSANRAIITPVGKGQQLTHRIHRFEITATWLLVIVDSNFDLSNVKYITFGAEELHDFYVAPTLGQNNFCGFGYCPNKKEANIFKM
jgi:hypothetical protein